MIDLKKMRADAIAAIDGPDHGDAVALKLAESLTVALAEIESLRIALGRHDAAREERIKDYRCAAMPGVLDGISIFDVAAFARTVEDLAHAMLAAERPAVALDKETP